VERNARRTTGQSTKKFAAKRKTKRKRRIKKKCSQNLPLFCCLFFSLAKKRRDLRQCVLPNNAAPSIWLWLIERSGYQKLVGQFFFKGLPFGMSGLFGLDREIHERIEGKRDALWEKEVLDW
jgi:hypothetical protein